MSAAWNKLLEKVYGVKNLEEAKALAEPSIMDEKIKKSDPEQYAKILQAQQLMGDLNAGMNYASPIAVGSLKAIPSILNSISKVDAAKDALSDIAGTSGLSTYEGVFKDFSNKSFNPEDLFSHIEKLHPHELEKALEESYLGGVDQFLKDYRKEYAPKLYLDYVKSFHAAKDPKVKEKLKGIMDSIKAEGIHPND
jgi:hypothetical protein